MTCITCGGTGTVSRNGYGMGAHMLHADQSIMFELEEGMDRMLPCPDCKNRAARSDPLFMQGYAVGRKEGYDVGYTEGLQAGARGAQKAEELLG